MPRNTMIDYFVVLLIAIILLLFVQIAALVRVRLLIKQLKTTLNTLNSRFGLLQIKTVYPKSLIKCRFCKYRNSFINSTAGGQDEEPFFYQCALDEKSILLDYSCSKFQPEPFYLKSHLSQNSSRKG